MAIETTTFSMTIETEEEVTKRLLIKKQLQQITK